VLNSKQRSYLKSLASELTDTIFVGKEGISSNVIKQLSDELKANELVKGKVLDSSFLEIKEAAQQLAVKTNAEVVHTIGKKFVLYKENKEKAHIILP
jgi:RNA-binding protein